ncbi:MAG TPA: hypothetical protein VNB94_12375 [Mycobacteriales bacterium]|nr:hypothetical protein [Mycobacteriales bacterium]
MQSQRGNGAHARRLRGDSVHARRVRGDGGDIVVGWLTKITLVLALLSLIGYEMVSLGIARVRTEDVAVEVAREGSEQWQRNRDVQQAYAAGTAVAFAKGGQVNPEEFVVEPDGTVSVTVCREAASLLLYRTKRTRKWLKTCETARAKYVA